MVVLLVWTQLTQVIYNIRIVKMIFSFNYSLVCDSSSCNNHSGLERIQSQGDKNFDASHGPAHVAHAQFLLPGETGETDGEISSALAVAAGTTLLSLIML